MTALPRPIDWVATPSVGRRNSGHRGENRPGWRFWAIRPVGTLTAIINQRKRTIINIDDVTAMKLIRNLILAGLTFAAISGASEVLAQSTPTPPIVAPHSGTAGLPPEIKTLLTSFDTTRDAYLTQQVALLGQLKNATTATEREQIRDALQANREAFLAELKTFRTELKDDLIALKGKISHAEFLRIIDAAHDVTGEGGKDHHKGH
jgi:hypothetical protein